ncbi:MAG: GAF domain-containing protein [Thermoplasmata archaeon]|nr:GAF domain-containing protein [Thermoplasmata archaeon]
MPVRPVEAAPALLQVDAILTRLTGGAALTEVCRFLRDSFLHYNWVGVYRLDGASLFLVGWDGERATEHVEIPLGKGLCGRAAREDRTVIVGDVQSDPEYLACFLDTRSEIVVPVRSGGKVVGEIDVDGRRENAYDDSDDRFLNEVARRIAPMLLAPPTPAASSASPATPRPAGG